MTAVLSLFVKKAGWSDQNAKHKLKERPKEKNETMPKRMQLNHSSSHFLITHLKPNAFHSRKQNLKTHRRKRIDNPNGSNAGAGQSFWHVFHVFFTQRKDCSSWQKTVRSVLVQKTSKQRQANLPRVRVTLRGDFFVYVLLRLSVQVPQKEKFVMRLCRWQQSFFLRYFCRYSRLLLCSASLSF